jgi:DNA-binding IclR family transcriptional regulator
MSASSLHRESPLSGGSYLQTLSRGLHVLDILAALNTAPTAAEIAKLAGLPMPVTYRVLVTLRAHKMVRVDNDGRYTLGYGLISLGRNVDADFRLRTHEVLSSLAQHLGVTVFIGAEDGEDFVTISSAEPTRLGTHVRWRDGLRHRMGSGAGSAAILAARDGAAGSASIDCISRRYTTSASEIEPGIQATAFPVVLQDGSCTMSLVTLQPEDTRPFGTDQLDALRKASRAIAEVASVRR